MQIYVPLIARYSWDAVIYWVYTGQVKFSSIGSKDIGSSQETKDDIQGAGNTPGDPNVLLPSDIELEPCSPKSVYRLAYKVCPMPLLDEVSL